MYKTSIEQKKQAFIDATSFREPEKVPVGAQFNYWPLAYGNMGFAEAEIDKYKTVEAYFKFFDDVNVDFFYGSNFTLSPMSTFKTLGNKSYEVGDDGLTIGVNQAEAFRMEYEDYELLIKDPITFSMDTFLRHNFPVLMGPKEEAYEKIKQAANKYRFYVETDKLLVEEIDRRDMLALRFDNAQPIAYASPFNDIFTKYRDMKDALVDLRRHHNIVIAACDAIWETTYQPMFDAVSPCDVAEAYPFANTWFLSEPFLNHKQFDELYFDRLDRVVRPYLEAGTKFMLRGEGSFIQFMDRFEDLPKGSICITCDSDDIFELHKAIGYQHSIWGGITQSLLKYGTVDECRDYVKKCFDIIAPGGGFVFMPNNALVGKNDVKYENIIAVFEEANRLGTK